MRSPGVWRWRHRASAVPRPAKPARQNMSACAARRSDPSCAAAKVFSQLRWRAPELRVSLRVSDPARDEVSGRTEPSPPAQVSPKIVGVHLGDELHADGLRARGLALAVVRAAPEPLRVRLSGHAEDPVPALGLSLGQVAEMG